MSGVSAALARHVVKNVDLIAERTAREHLEHIQGSLE